MILSSERREQGRSLVTYSAEISLSDARRTERIFDPGAKAVEEGGQISSSTQATPRSRRAPRRGGRYYDQTGYGRRRY
ncbi:MAG: hypothetical protein ACLRSW_16810 [Christensenellaceae bacterium]